MNSPGGTGPVTTKHTATVTGPGKWVQVLVVYLAGLPRTGVFLGALALVLTGLFLPGAVGAVLILLLEVVVGAVFTATWPLLTWRRRIPQLMVLLLATAVVVAKLL